MVVERNTKFFKEVIHAITEGILLGRLLGGVDPAAAQDLLIVITDDRLAGG